MNKLYKDLPWMEIHEFLLMAGNIHKPKEFCLYIAENVSSLIPFDQARIFFFNNNGKIFDTVLYGNGADRNWIDAYFQYYSKLEDGRYSLVQNGLRTESSIFHNYYDWSNAQSSEFISDYIVPQGLQYSLVVLFHDESELTKAVCTFDRTIQSNFTKKELAIIEVLQAHLDNLHKNLFVVIEEKIQDIGSNESELSLLTQREKEIVKLICAGLTSANISNKLYISKSTVYRHIANIYEKLHISNRQELMLISLK